MLVPHRVRLTFWWVLLLMALVACGDSPQKTDAGGDSSVPPQSKQRQWVSGSVLDANAAPVAGAEVRLGALLATSDSAGRFGLVTFAGVTDRAVKVTASGYLPAERLLPAGGGARRELAPLMLFQADGSLTLDGRDGGKLVAQAAGLEVTVPPRAFDGSVTLRTARVPLGDPLRDPLRLPAPLPRQADDSPVAPLFAVLLDAGGAQPAIALTVVVTTGAGLPAGTSVPLGRFDEATGAWVDAGQATAETGTLRFTTNHLSTFAAALPALPADETAAPELGTLSRAISPLRPGEPRLDPRSGALQLGFSLPPLWRRGEPQQLALFYDSRTVRPTVTVPVAARDAHPGEALLARVVTDLGHQSLSFSAAEPSTDQASPGLAVEAVSREAPERWAADESISEEEPPSQLLETGSYTASVAISRQTPGVLAGSASGQFTDPVPGEALRGADDQPLPAPQPLELRRHDQLAVAVENRRESPFGPGWQLSGLTRLVQPWCSADRVTLAGERDWPAVTFGASSEPTLRSLAEVLVAAGKERDDLRDSKVALSGGALYVALPTVGEIWRLSQSGSDPTLFAGGGAGTTAPGQGKATDLRLDGLQAISAGPRGEGILLATTHYISHVLPDGSASRVAGTGTTSCDSDDIRVDESPLNSTFCNWLSFTLAADPTSDRFVFGLLGQGSLEVVEGKLRRLRTREGSPHWHNVAFDHQGTLYYASDTGLCIYRHEDGLNDPLLFPRCAQAGQEPLEDGPAETAMAGNARGIAFDSNGVLWFFDGKYGVLRRYTIGGELLTITAPPAPGTSSSATVPGALIGGAVLGSVESLAVTDPLHLYLGGRLPEDLCSTAPLAAGTLTAMGSGDGSLLLAQEDGAGWVRMLESGWIERYDARGLLQSRGQPGEPPMEFVYQGDWELAREDETCGRPTAPPPLARIELAGEALWSLEYRDGQLQRITDAAKRSLTRSAAGDSDSFALPGNATVKARYDDQGRVVEKTSPGPDGGVDRWAFEWSEGRLSAWTDPSGQRQLVTAAESSVAVTAGDFDAAGLAQEAQARIPTADLPTSGGERAKLVLGDHGVTITSPAGDETALHTDAFGRLLRVIHPDGAALQLSRDAVGRIVGLRNENLDETWRYRYGRVLANSNQPYLDERLVERIDPQQRRTTWRYDAAGALIERTDPAGTVKLQVAASGASRGLPTRLVDGAGQRFEVSYDDRGNTTRFAVVDAGPPEQTLETLIERDSAGRPVRVVEPGGRVLQTEYEPWGEVTRHTVGDQASGHTLTLERAVTAAWTTVAGALPAAPLLRARDGEGREWRFVHQPGWRLSERLTPASGREAWEHDDQGRLTERTLADGSREQLTLDSDGRVQERRWLGPATGAWLSFAYDERGRVAEQGDPLRQELREYLPGFGWSRLTVQGSTPADAEASFELTRWRPRTGVESQTLGESRVTLHRGYDGRVERVERGSSSGGDAELLVFERDGARRLTSVTRANGTRSELRYDALGRVVEQREITPAGTSEIAYGWNGDRPASRTRAGSSRTFSWDARGRLVGCSDTGESFDYDKAGARAAVDGRSVSRDTAGRMTGDGQFSYTYDALGRRIERTALADAADRTVYEYGPGGHLARVAHGPAGAETELARYAYDGAGRRVERITASGRWLVGYLPDSDRPVRLREPSGAIWQLVQAQPSASWEAALAGDGRERYVHLDPFQRVIGVSDEHGVLTWLDDDCFGALQAPFQPGGPPIGLHGMAHDAETGLFLAGARYYDPAAGEFLTPDPRGIEGGPAAYGYGNGDPLLAQDPGGRILFMAALGALAVGAMVFNEIRKVAQSSDTRRARRGYEAMGDVATDDDALGEAERAHKDLAKASVKAGETAVKTTVSACQAVTSPAENFEDLAEAGMNLAESLMDEGADGDPPDNE